VLHHVELYVSELARTRVFWTPLLAKLGYQVTGSWGDGFTLSNERDAYLTFVQVADAHSDVAFHRCKVGLNHLAFTAPNRATVDAMRTHCLETGATCLYDDRYPFANGGSEYYALFVEDPDRIKVEFVAA
jgi:catechol 2,3-dioxygenase-like lactoylglutathione lyase family enzyme